MLIIRSFLTLKHERAEALRAPAWSLVDRSRCFHRFLVNSYHSHLVREFVNLGNVWGLHPWIAPPSFWLNPKFITSDFTRKLGLRTTVSHLHVQHFACIGFSIFHLFIRCSKDFVVFTNSLTHLSGVIKRLNSCRLWTIKISFTYTL